jgi:NADH-quinone oxidoreductase subunit K
MQLDLVIFNSLFLLLSLLGVFLRRYNILIILICIELSLLALSLIFISLSYYLDNIIGKIFTLFILTLAATESALGLGILLAFFRTRGFILLEGFTTLKN